MINSKTIARLSAIETGYEEYKIGNDNGDCDATVDTHTTIQLLEIKI